MKKLQMDNIPNVPSNMLDAFDRLRVNLEVCGDKPKKIVVTSSVADEGKTFVSLQLWKRLANTRTSTLLIDCDLQNSHLYSKYNSGDSKEPIGLVQYLSGQVELEDVLYETNIQDGYILPAGAGVEKAAGLFKNERFSKMMEICEKKFGCVLIDTPSMNTFADVMTIAAQCGGVLFVVRSAVTSRKRVEDSIVSIRRTGTPLLGIILNRFGASD